MENIEAEGKKKMFAVPEQWLKSLLQDATELEALIKKWEYGNSTNDRVVLKASALMGYAKSAQSILAHNEIESPQTTLPK